VLITISIYCVDTITAIRLLRFNSWSNGVKPAIPFQMAKWIFTACIVLSWALAMYYVFVALYNIKRGFVTDDYLDQVAMTLQSIRPKTGWRRFLVFLELTKSRKKISWIAIFVYFQLRGSVKLVFVDGPRQIINGLTLVSVARSRFLNQSPSSLNSFRTFWAQLSAMNKPEIVILGSMAFSLAIWVISVACLLSALLLYFALLNPFLRSQSLTRFCRQKVEHRLERIVKLKMEKIITSGIDDRTPTLPHISMDLSMEANRERVVAPMQNELTLPTSAMEREIVCPTTSSSKNIRPANMSSVQEYPIIEMVPRGNVSSRPSQRLGENNRPALRIDTTYGWACKSSPSTLSKLTPGSTSTFSVLEVSDQQTLRSGYSINVGISAANSPQSPPGQSRSNLRCGP
jgi:hypothetical protein